MSAPLDSTAARLVHRQASFDRQHGQQRTTAFASTVAVRRTRQVQRLASLHLELIADDVLLSLARHGTAAAEPLLLRQLARTPEARGRDNAETASQGARESARAGSFTIASSSLFASEERHTRSHMSLSRVRRSIDSSSWSSIMPSRSDSKRCEKSESSCAWSASSNTQQRRTSSTCGESAGTLRAFEPSAIALRGASSQSCDSARSNGHKLVSLLRLGSKRTGASADSVGHSCDGSQTLQALLNAVDK